MTDQQQPSPQDVADAQPQKPHLSSVQLEMIGKCPEQWRRRYLEKEVIPPGIALVRGRSVHAGAEHNFRQKIRSHTDLPASHIVERAVAQVEAEIRAGVTLSNDEASVGLRKVTGQTVDMVAKLARLHAQTQAPEYQPAHVELPIRVSLPQSPRDLLCVIDLVTDVDEVVDFKTGKPHTQREADESIQLTAYHFARQVQTGHAPTGLAMDIMVAKDTKLARQKIKTTRTDSDVNALGERFSSVVNMIEAGVFPGAPTGVGCWWCSAKWCGYHSTCKFVGNSARNQGD